MRLKIYINLFLGTFLANKRILSQKHLLSETPAKKEIKICAVKYTCPFASADSLQDPSSATYGYPDL